jgi:hypothetical protein
MRAMLNRMKQSKKPSEGAGPAEPQGDDAKPPAPSGGRLRRSLSFVGQNNNDVKSSGSRRTSGTFGSRFSTVGADLHLYEGGIGAMVYSLFKSLPSDALKALTVRNERELKAKIKVLAGNLDQSNMDEEQPDIAGELPLDSLLRAIEASPELRTKCLELAPKAEKSMGRLTVDSAGAKLAFNKMRFLQRKLDAEKCVEKERLALRVLTEAPAPHPDAVVKAQADRYKESLVNMVKVFSQGHILTEFERLVDETVEAGQKTRDNLLAEKQGKYEVTPSSETKAGQAWETTRNVAGKLPKVAISAAHSQLPTAIDTNNARLQAMVFLAKSDPAFAEALGVEILHGDEDLQSVEKRERAASKAHAAAQSDQAGGSGLNSLRASLHSRLGDHRIITASRKELELGIELASLRTIPAKITTDKNPDLINYLLGCNEVRTAVLAAIQEDPNTAEAGIMFGTSISAKDIVASMLSGTGPTEAQSEGSEGSAEVAPPRVLASASSKLAARLKSVTTASQRNLATIKEGLSAHFEGAELENLAVRCEKIGLKEVCDLMRTLGTFMDRAISEDFPQTLQTLFRDAVTLAEKNPEFAETLSKVWGDSSRSALVHPSGNNNIYRKTNPEVAYLGLHVIEMLVNSEKSARGDFDENPAAMVRQLEKAFIFNTLVHRVSMSVLDGITEVIPFHTAVLRAAYALEDSLELTQHFKSENLLDKRPFPSIPLEGTGATMTRMKKNKQEHDDNLLIVGKRLEDYIARVKSTMSRVAGKTQFMNAATQDPGFQAAFARIAPEVHKRPEFDKTGIDSLDKKMSNAANATFEADVHLAAVKFLAAHNGFLDVKPGPASDSADASLESGGASSVPVLRQEV